MNLKINIDNETYNHFLNNNYTRDDVIAVHNALINAEPDIIRCKNCKNFQRWRTTEQSGKFGHVYECSKLIITCPEPDDYCSKAEAKEPSTITQIKCPHCHTCWENVSVPKDIWDHGKFICSKCGADLTQQKEDANESRWNYELWETKCLNKLQTERKKEEEK